MTFTHAAQKLDYLSNQIRDEILHACKCGHWLNQTAALYTRSSAPNSLSSPCRSVRDPEWHFRRETVGRCHYIRSQSECSWCFQVRPSVALWTSCLCSCTEPCDCHVSGSTAKSHSGHLQISECCLNDSVSSLSNLLLFLSVLILAGVLNNCITVHYTWAINRAV